LVLADGHHRFETACNYREQLRDAGEPVGGAGQILSLVVELSEDELWIDAVHRLVTLPDGVDVRARLADAFTVIDAGANTPEAVEHLQRRMQDEGGLGLVDRAGLALAIPRGKIAEVALVAEPEAVRATDAAVVETMVVPR